MFAGSLLILLPIQLWVHNEIREEFTEESGLCFEINIFFHTQVSNTGLF